jgi:hypothetical protein
MTFNDYQQQAMKTAIFTQPFYPFASLMIEAAEYADLVTKPMLRGDNVPIDPQEMIAEAGDVLWNLAASLDQYSITLDQVATYNIQKLKDRAARGVIQGSGGNR